VTTALVSRYPLTGVRAATTEPQKRLMTRATEVLSADERVVAAYLVGGFAVGLGDAWSDVDLQCLVRDEDFTDIASNWRDLVARIAPTVFVEPFGALPGGPSGPVGGVCITPEWLHFDIVFHSVASVDGHAVVGMMPLFDRAHYLPDAPVPRPEDRRAPFFPDAALRMFLYQLGNMVTVIGRNEVVAGTNGVFLLRDIALVSLLLAEQGLDAANGHKVWLFPFTKRLRTYLTDEQNALLASLPPVAPTLDSIIDGYIALAEAFLPRARRLAAETGTEWPVQYERATLDYFQRSLGVTVNV
jgi:hypothetical protein